MNRYRFTDEEIPYETLAQFGLTQEMIGDLPLNILQQICMGRRSPVLPIRIDDGQGNRIHSRTRFALIRHDDGTADVVFYPVLTQSHLERFSDESRRMLQEGKAVIDTMTGSDGKQIQAFHQIDPDTRQILSVPTPVIGRNLQVIANEFHLSNAEINCLRNGEPLTLAENDELITVGIHLNEATGILVCTGDIQQWRKETGKDRNKYNFGCFGCWVRDDEGNLNYVREENYTDELWEELKKSGMMKPHATNTPKL